VITIDLGCGEDPERWLSGAIRVDPGTDVDYAQEHGIIRMEAKNLPFKDNSIDHVFARNSISYTFGPREALEEVFAEVLRVLKPNGLFTIIELLEGKGADMLLEYQEYGPDAEGYKLMVTTKVMQLEDLGNEEPAKDFVLMFQKL